MHEWSLGNHRVTEVSERSLHFLETLKEIQLTEILHDSYDKIFTKAHHYTPSRAS